MLSVRGDEVSLKASILHRLRCLLRTYVEQNSSGSQTSYCNNLNVNLHPVNKSYSSLKGFNAELLTYTPQQIANYFLKRSFDEGISVSVMKLLKLVYIAYGWNWALRDGKLFEEHIEAWEHGPVIPTLYHEFKHYRKRPIREFAEDYDEYMEETYVPKIASDDADVITVLSKVWAAYKTFSAWSLREKTHEKGGPWDLVYNPSMRSVVLNDDDIKSHYSDKIGQYIAAAKSA